MPSNRSSARRRTSTTPGRKGKTKQTSSGGGDLYQLESLKDYEVRNGIEYFLVKWEGYPDEQNTWEPVSNIVHPTQDLIEQMKELRLMSQASQKSLKVRKSASKKRKIETVAEKKPRPLKTQKVTERLSSSTQSHQKAKASEVDENAQPLNLTLQGGLPTASTSRPDHSDMESLHHSRSHSAQNADLQSPKALSHNEEDTSPEEASATHPLRFDGMIGKEVQTLPDARCAFLPPKNEENRTIQIKEECVVVESVCKENIAQPFENQENLPPVCPESLQFLSHLSVVVCFTQDIEVEGSSKLEVRKVKMPLLEVAEKHTKALLAYFLQNVRYYKHSKSVSADGQAQAQPSAPQYCDAGCQADPEVKESQTQTCESASPSSPSKPPDEIEESSPPMTPIERQNLATAPHSAASRESVGNKLVTVG